MDYTKWKIYTYHKMLQYTCKFCNLNIQKLLTNAISMVINNVKQFLQKNQNLQYMYTQRRTRTSSK